MAAVPAPTAMRSPPVATPAPATAVIKPRAVASAATHAAAAASAPARVPSRNELPSELRAALPPINVSGAVYAPVASERLLFVNGGVLREGDAIAVGLTIERIGASTTILVFRGTRFEIRN
jgi:general secretion pathway protein B